MAETNIKTFDVQVTPEMAPSSDITVWHITREGRLVSASTAFVVSSQGKNDVSAGTKRYLVFGFVLCALERSGCANNGLAYTQL